MWAGYFHLTKENKRQHDFNVFLLYPSSVFIWRHVVSYLFILTVQSSPQNLHVRLDDLRVLVSGLSTE